jgi:Rrf2 family nitric oxide-sensitive transcriptional repressor
MQLDKFTDYALRILMTLAVRTPERISTSAIAKMYGLSEHHLSKVASELARGGFVISERGRSGGLTLAMPADQINIGAVVRYLKADDAVVECFGKNASCLVLPACGLRDPLSEAKEAFFQALDAYSLAQVTSAKPGLSKLLAS